MSADNIKIEKLTPKSLGIIKMWANHSMPMAALIIEGVWEAAKNV